MRRSLMACAADFGALIEPRAANGFISSKETRMHREAIVIGIAVRLA
jgi:hypothetical protein